MPRTTTNRRRVPHFVEAWRVYRDLTQAQLAERMGMRASSISKIETGVTWLTETRIVSLAEALRIRIGDLFRSPTDQTDVWALAELIARLPLQQRETARRLIEALIPAEDNGRGQDEDNARNGQPKQDGSNL